MDFTWKEEYNLGIQKIDEQHKQIFDCLAELNDAILDEKPKEILDGILESVLEFSKSHFDYEESLLEENNYSNLEDHKVLHSIFEERIEKLIDTFEHGKDLQKHLADFLDEWLLNHIDKEDKKFVEFLHNKEIY